MDQRIVSIYRILKKTFFGTFKNSIFANLGKNFLTVYRFSISNFSHPIRLLGQFRDYCKKKLAL